MHAQAQLLGAHALGKAQELRVVQHGDVVDIAELFLDLLLTLVKLQVTERTDIDNTVDTDLPACS